MTQCMTSEKYLRNVCFVTRSACLCARMCIGWKYKLSSFLWITVKNAAQLTQSKFFQKVKFIRNKFLGCSTVKRRGMNYESKEIWVLF